MSMNILLIRHGYSLGNKERTLSGWTDVPLIDEGREELHRFRVEKDFPQTDKYFSSDLSRAVETTEILFPDKEFVTLPEFREINFGVYEGALPEQLNYAVFLKGWLSGDLVENGESFADFRNRIINAFNNLNSRVAKAGADSYTLVSHAGVMRAIYTHLHKTSGEEFFHMAVPNGGGFHISYDMKKQEMLSCREI